MDMILLVKEKCQKCDWLKSKIPDQAKNNGLKIINAEDPEGISHLAYNELIVEGKPIDFPVLIIDEEVIQGETIKMRNRINEEIQKQETLDENKNN